MESEGVSLPWIHEHSMVPWNHIGKGDCCGRIETITDGYYCEDCQFFVHKKCSELSEYIEHPSHHNHILQLRRNPHNNCSLCGRGILNLFYRCEVCDFNMDLCCIKYPPPELIDTSEKHHHNLNLFKMAIKFDCDAKCGKNGENEFSYRCYECASDFHIDCVWDPLEIKYKTIDIGNKVLLPLVHGHLMVPSNDMAKGDCCGRFEDNTDGFYCKRCDFFIHKKCSESTKYIKHPNHSDHLLELKIYTIRPDHRCHLCAGGIKNLYYRCEICDFDIDLYCVRYPPPEVTDISEAHHHKLSFLKMWIGYDYYCHACGKASENKYVYKCDGCDLTFHVDCVWQQPEVKHSWPLEVNHSSHSLHLLKIHKGQVPDYSDGKCCLCDKMIDKPFYHCSTCNFTLDMRCILNPPPQSLMDLKVHHHQLTLLPRLDSFTCNACSLKGDRSRYVCFQCGFTIHKECLGLPRVININRHDHRVSRTSVLGVANSVCGICRRKVEWVYGGYSCLRCHGYVVHAKCATREDVWNGKELEEVPEEIEDIEPYVVIDENTIQHFSHKEHYLGLQVNGVIWEEKKWCKACNHPIGLQSFYGCIDCDFVLHQSCAEFPRKKWHLRHNEQLTLVTTADDSAYWCAACYGISNGFVYKHMAMKLDVRCSSISEPFVHPSHPQHPLYHIPRDKEEICNGCNKEEEVHVLRCIEDGCEFVLGFKCATLPQLVKHRVDDHPLSLCYGEEEAIGKYWCDICEKECDPKTWFYTSKDHMASLHTECVVGDFVGLMIGSTMKGPLSSYEVVLNNSVSRPFCERCKLRCMYPIILKVLRTSNTYRCSLMCSI